MGENRAMALRSTEARVLACLIEKEVAVPDSYPLTLNALRLACNQTTNRRPVVAYDDRTVETALLSLKSMGLVRFVHPAHGGRTTRYRHSADERWRLSPAELGVLAALVLRGPQTVSDVRARVERHLDENDGTVEEILDTLAARSPEPFATRLDRRPGERDTRYAHLLSGEVDELDDEPPPARDASREQARPAASVEGGDLWAEVTALRARIDRLEGLLGVTEVDDDDLGREGS
jgi:uncharacterized protein YceH (UPF0502 family)